MPLIRSILPAALLLAALLATPPAAAAGIVVDNLADLVARLLPSVVNINTVRVEKAASDVPPPGDASAAAATSKSVGTRRKSLGTGFVIDPAGIIVTNKHVIEGASDIHVTFTDGTVLAAELMSDAGRVDLAILRVNPDAPLHAVTFGDSDAMRQGDGVIAIGKPRDERRAAKVDGILGKLDRRYAAVFTKLAE